MEVVLAVALTVGLMAAALAFYQHVVKARDNFTNQLRTAQATAAQRRVMDRITDDLRSALVFRFLQMGLSGQPMQMSFTTAALPGPGVWATQDMTDRPIPPQHDIRIVGYRLRISENEDGEEVVEGLERTIQQVLTAPVVEEGQEIQAALIAPQFKFVAFYYWDRQASEWVNSWEGGNLPPAVEIVLGIEPLPETLEPEDYPYETYRRMVYLPGVAPAASGNVVIRGLGGQRR
jgi:hypothetical protein